MLNQKNVWNCDHFVTKWPNFGIPLARSHGITGFSLLAEVLLCWSKSKEIWFLMWLRRSEKKIRENDDLKWINKICWISFNFRNCNNFQRKLKIITSVGEVKATAQLRGSHLQSWKTPVGPKFCVSTAPTSVKNDLLFVVNFQLLQTLKAISCCCTLVDALGLVKALNKSLPSRNNPTLQLAGCAFDLHAKSVCEWCPIWGKNTPPPSPWFVRFKLRKRHDHHSRQESSSRFRTTVATFCVFAVGFKSRWKWMANSKKFRCAAEQNTFKLTDKVQKLSLRGRTKYS
jgi:hypothetical protein